MRIILKYLCKKQIFTISSILILGLVGIFASTGCTVKKEEAPIWALALAGGGSSQTAADGEAGTSGATAKLPVKTGQTTVYETGDDGTPEDLQWFSGILGNKLFPKWIGILLFDVGLRVNKFLTKVFIVYESIDCSVNY
jgi:hypothetical protein